jgi:hypothetical protein
VINPLRSEADAFRALLYVVGVVLVIAVVATIVKLLS